MKIAYISYELPPDIAKGGIGTYTLQAAAAMLMMGNVVHIFSGSLKRNITEKLGDLVVHRSLCSNPKDFAEKVLSNFTNEHNSSPFDIIECAEIHANAIFIKKAFPSLPLVVKLHAPNHLVESLKKTYSSTFSKLRVYIGAWRRGKFNRGWGYYNKLIDTDYNFTLLASAVIAPSQAVKDWVVNNWDISAELIRIVGNPFSPPVELNVSVESNISNFKTILFFGRLNVLKGLVNFTKAVKLFLLDNTDWKIEVIGDDANGPFHHLSMKSWMQTYFGSLNSRIHFFEGLPHSELYSKIMKSDIIVLPSLFESFSYACAEAMAAGKAIIGSNKGGMKELLGAGEMCGILIDPYNSNEILNAIKRLAEDENLRNELGFAAKSKIYSPLYNIEIAKQMMLIYNEVIKDVGFAKN